LLATPVLLDSNALSMVLKPQLHALKANIVPLVMLTLFLIALRELITLSSTLKL
jgi:hypothetical protein